MAKSNETEQKPEKIFTKQQVLKSERYKKYRDLLSFVLEEEAAYTCTMVDEKIHRFLTSKIS